MGRMNLKVRNVLIGIGISLKTDKTPLIYTEYHRCDDCDTEYRLHYKHNDDLSRLFRLVAEKLVSREDDRCFTCINKVALEQRLLPI